MRWEKTLWIVYFIGNISATNYQNQFMYVEVTEVKLFYTFLEHRIE